MLVKILKSFPYAADGLHTRELKADAEEQVHDHLVEGLKAEGFVTEIAPPGPKAEKPARATKPPAAA